MTVLAASLFLFGLVLSALFSGSETGFYRVTRVRLVLDARDGDRVARALLWLTNNPALFVASTLIGNNVANYVTSLGLVLMIQYAGLEAWSFAELAAPLLMTPVVFVYGESLPKSLFFHAPNRLLRRVGPFFLVFALLFSPVAIMLWMLGRVLESLLGQTPLRLQLALARRELQQVLQEGQEAGLLSNSQWRWAQNLFTTAPQLVRRFAKSPGRLPAVRPGTPIIEVERIVQRLRMPIVLVQSEKTREPIGYVRMVDLALREVPQVDQFEPLVELSQNETHIAALLRLQAQRAEVGKLLNDKGEVTGVVFLSDLRRAIT